MVINYVEEESGSGLMFVPYSLSLKRFVVDWVFTSRLIGNRKSVDYVRTAPIHRILNTKSAPIP